MTWLPRFSQPAPLIGEGTATSTGRALTTEKPRRSLRSTAGLALLIVGSASACSSGGGHATGIAAGGPTPTTAAPSDASAYPTTPSTVKASGGGDFCKLVAASYNSGIAQGPQTDTSPAGMKKRYQDAQALSRQAIDVAPSAIRGDLQTLDAASSKFYAALATANYDMTKLPHDATAGFSAPEVQAASTRLLAYVKDHCGIDLGGDSTAGGSATTKP